MKKQFAVAIMAILLLSVLTAMPVMAGSGDESNSTLTDDRGQTPYVPPLTMSSYPPIATISPVCEELQSYLDCVSTKKADIVFVFDTTGSMYDEIDEMKNISKDFADGLATAGIDYRLGLTEFRDFPVTCDGTACGDLGDFAYKVYNGGVLTSSASTFKSWIGGLSASGGADLPESTLAALTHTVKDQKWRGGDASKIVILISDAYPHPDGHCCNQEGNKFSGVISALTRNGITVYVVGPDDASMKKIADVTGGEFYLIRAGVTLKPILEKITGVIRCSFSIVGDEIACEDNKLEICVQLRGKDNVLIPYRSGYTKAWMYVRCPDGTSHRYDLNYDNKTKSYCATVDPVCGGEPGDVDVTVYGKVCEWSAVERFEVTCGIRKVFFSTEEDFVTFGPEPPDGNPIISDGDLLCSGCTIFARNRELLAVFGTERDLGLDAADVIDVERRLVAFSTELNDLERKVFECDLLVTNGAVIPHFALLAKFDIPDGVILGLDAIHFIGDKEKIVAFLEDAAKYDRDFWMENPSALPEMLEEYDIDIWFSTEGTAPTPEAPHFLDGDLLSARTGIIVARNALLLPPSVPAGIPNRGVDFGLDAVTADRSGNRELIRFSTEILYEGEPYFTDGDVLRIGNGVVCTNEELIKCFEPKVNFLGLDALSIPVKEVCKPSIEMEKKVLDKIEQVWVEQITAHVGDTVTFQSKIHNDGTCCPLYDIKVTDILPDSLEYANNAMVNGKQREPDEINDKELTWFFEGPINPCETITIKYNARVVKCGVDINVQRVKAVCEETGEAVYDEDKATIVVPCVVRKPDLVIKDVKLKKMDGYCWVVYLVSNTGTVNAAASTTYLYVDDKKVASNSTSALAPGASRWDRFTAYRTTGTHTYKVCADGPNAISESNEANNCRTEKLTCPLSLDIYFADGGESPGSVYHYNTTTGIEETVYTRPSRRLYSFTFHPHIPQKLYYVNANENKIYRTLQLPSGWTSEEVIYTHTTYVRDIAFSFGKDDELRLYFSEATGAGENGKIYKIEDGKASLYYEVKLPDVGGFWAGDFAFDDKGNLYLSSGNRIPASIYKVEDGKVKEIFKDEKEPISGLVYADGALYYANWGTKIYRLDISTKERTVVYSNTKRTWLSDVDFRPGGIG